MDIQPAADLSPRELETKISGLHFFKEVALNDHRQLRMLVSQSQLMSAGPGEVLLKSGEQDTRLYFLMQGELHAYSSGEEPNHLGTLIAGEVFGDISVITNNIRKSDIIVPVRGRAVLVLALDFTLLADMEQHVLITLETKLIVYRQIVHMLRWRSDLYRIKFPDNSLARKPYKQVRMSGHQSLQEELLALRAQAEYLAQRLQTLNARLGAVDGTLQKTGS